MKIQEPRITYVSFLECELRGKWIDELDRAVDKGVNPKDLIDIKPESAEFYISSGNDCELWLVRPDGMRKAWIFKNDSWVFVVGSTVKFFQSQVSEEIAINEEEQFPKNKEIGD
ncbi:MAG: hypothetical protein IIA83_04370 [Thaumarchaeota archaeon]|nr:hypothetical protein [Nitrososphaerota archaeon]